MCTGNQSVILCAYMHHVSAHAMIAIFIVLTGFLLLSHFAKSFFCNEVKMQLVIHSTRITDKVSELLENVTGVRFF